MSGGVGGGWSEEKEDEAENETGSEEKEAGPEGGNRSKEKEAVAASEATCVDGGILVG